MIELEKTNWYKLHVGLIQNEHQFKKETLVKVTKTKGKFVKLEQNKMSIFMGKHKFFKYVDVGLLTKLKEVQHEKSTIGDINIIQT